MLGRCDLMKHEYGCLGKQDKRKCHESLRPETKKGGRGENRRNERRKEKVKKMGSLERILSRRQKKVLIYKIFLFPFVHFLFYFYFCLLFFLFVIIIFILTHA